MRTPRPKKQAVTVRLPPALIEEGKSYAREHHTTFTQIVIWGLQGLLVKEKAPVVQEGLVEKL
jgi:hypothetical protein